MADKRVSDLDPIASLEEDSLFHVRNVSQNEDFKITKSNLVKSLGNSVIQGFVAESEDFNKLTLTPSNNGVLDQYYEGMIVQFISPIYSNNLVQIRIGNLPYIALQTTFINPITFQTEPTILKVGKFYTAMYKEGLFIQVNIDRQYTNEYLSNGEILYDIVFQTNYTLYNLTSATSYYKEDYYEGMSIIFTSGIIQNSQENMSEGKIYVNVDNLGLRELSDPDGDGIPFSLQPNESIMGIYDGEKFIKNMFTMQEPNLPIPIDPDNPPPGYDITIYIGPDEQQDSNKTLQKAFNRILQDYGQDGKGRRVLIKFRNNYNGEGLLIRSCISQPYITIEGNPNVVMQPINTYHGKTIIGLQGDRLNDVSINLTGHWKTNFPVADSGFRSDYCFLTNEMRSVCSIFIKDAIFTNTNVGNQNYAWFITRYTDLILNIENCEVINFGDIFLDNGGYGRYSCIAKDMKITNTITQTRSFSHLIRFYTNQNTGSSYSYFTFINLILSIAKPSNYTDIISNSSSCEISDTSILISENIVGYIISSNTQLKISNSTIKYIDSVNNTKGSLFLWGIENQYINGNDFVNKNSANIPDIIVSKCTLYLKTGTLGSTQILDGGRIVNV